MASDRAIERSEGDFDDLISHFCLVAFELISRVTPTLQVAVFICWHHHSISGKKRVIASSVGLIGFKIALITNRG